MIGSEFTYVEALKTRKMPWAQITLKFNEKFKEELKPTTLQKRYERELATRDSIGGTLVDKARSEERRVG